MTDHKDNNHIDPTLLDTQRLLLGVDLPEDVPFDLEDILAEYGGGHTVSYTHLTLPTNREV